MQEKRDNSRIWLNGGMLIIGVLWFWIGPMIVGVKTDIAAWMPLVIVPSFLALLVVSVVVLGTKSKWPLYLELVVLVIHMLIGGGVHQIGKLV
jgi:hypothetical protein